MNKEQIAIFWFRRDLRLSDNRGFYEALSANNNVLPIFIFDTTILGKLPENDPRVAFIHGTIAELNSVLNEKYNSGIAVYTGTPKEIFKTLVNTYSISAVYTNRDYEPYAKERDEQVKQFLVSEQIDFLTFKDQVIFEKDEVMKDDGNPYVVYTPYMKKWKSKLNAEVDIRNYETEKYFSNLYQFEGEFASLHKIGFRASTIKVKNYNADDSLIQNYENTRNYPALSGTSLLGPHLRFGTVSIRRLVEKALKAENKTFLNELIWREFFMQILWHYPHTVSKSFKPKYDRIVWRNNEDEFEAWCKGKTGYPIVDAGMRELNKTGYMHNRIRMITASFLCKHLLIDWRWGEAYFAGKLLDYEMASNIGNWQWVAGCGVDAAPYFRIFNPITQVKKFDKDHNYIKTWVKDLNELTYPNPIVEHKFARERCLGVYANALK